MEDNLQSQQQAPPVNQSVPQQTEESNTNQGKKMSPAVLIGITAGVAIIVIVAVVLLL